MKLSEEIWMVIEEKNVVEENVDGDNNGLDENNYYGKDDGDSK